MSSHTQTGTTLTRVREAQTALDKAQAAMDSVQRGLSTVETAAETESTRRHPVRTTFLVLLVASLAFAVMVVLKTAAD